MYIKEIISLISWPILIALSYIIIAAVVKKYENKTEVNE